MSSFESTRKYADGEYVDMCNRCFKASEYTGFVKERRDLQQENEENFDMDLIGYQDD